MNMLLEPKEENIYPNEARASVRGKKARDGGGSEESRHHGLFDNGVLNSLLVQRSNLRRQGAFKALQMILMLLGVVSVGAFIFTYLESDNEVQARREFQGLMRQVELRLNDTKLYNELVLLTGHPDEKYRDFEDYTRSWMFTFTVVTTTGFGLVTPRTAYGQVFCVVYSMLAIPITGICLGAVAEIVISKISKLLSSRNNTLEAAFAEFDSNASGELDHHEMRLALVDLGYDLDDYQFFDFMRQVDVDSDGKVSIDEFQIACEQLHINLSEVAARRKNLLSTVFIFIFWLVMGTCVFILTDMEGEKLNKHGRQWTWVESLYFCFTSLTTIGFGDYFPETKSGHVFLVFYCAVGLGILSVLVSLVQHFLSDLAERARQAINDNHGLKEKMLEGKINTMNSRHDHNNGVSYNQLPSHDDSTNLDGLVPKLTSRARGTSMPPLKQIQKPLRKFKSSLK